MVMVMVSLSRRLERLEEKYRLLADLRRRRDEVEAAGATGFSRQENATRTTAFRQVAREFPGALRELEHSTLAQLEARRETVKEERHALSVRPEAREPEHQWVAVVMAYHDTLREALAIKMWLAGHLSREGLLGAPALRAFLDWHRSHPSRHTPSEDFDGARLQLYRRPPGGRLHSIVWQELERRFSRSQGELERLVFHPPVQGGPPGRPRRPP